MIVLAATNNAHKLSEFKAILEPMGYKVISINELNINIDPEENGSTFEENSVIKATEFMKSAGMPVISDDSGLAVDYLSGAPGVYSARYAPGSDMDRVNKLLENMKNAENRTARFVSAVTMAFPDGRIITALGECFGEITYAPAGENGFGYDPVFYVKEFGKTFAELTPDQKNSISHRSRALKKLKEMLDKSKYV